MEPEISLPCLQQFATGHCPGKGEDAPVLS
jgi:hypothetical protein